MDSRVGIRSQHRHYPYWYEGTLSTWHHTPSTPAGQWKYRAYLPVLHRYRSLSQQVALRVHEVVCVTLPMRVACVLDRSRRRRVFRGLAPEYGLRFLLKARKRISNYGQRCAVQHSCSLRASTRRRGCLVQIVDVTVEKTFQTQGSAQQNSVHKPLAWSRRQHLLSLQWMPLSEIVLGRRICRTCPRWALKL